MKLERSMRARYASLVPAPEIYRGLHAKIRTTPSTRVSVRARTLAAAVLVPLVVAIAVALASEIVYGQQAVGLRFEVHSTAHMLWVLSLVVVLVLAATFVALRTGPRGWGSGVRELTVVSALVTPAYAALTLVNPVHYADLAGPANVLISAWGYRCLTLCAAVSIFVLGIFVTALRRAAPAAGALRGAALGAAAGTWAGLAVFIFCPSSNAQHLLIAHVLPILAFTLLGAVAVPRSLRP